jgi:hypothetical protein
MPKRRGVELRQSKPRGLDTSPKATLAEVFAKLPTSRH